MSVDSDYQDWGGGALGMAEKVGWDGMSRRDVLWRRVLHAALARPDQDYLAAVAAVAAEVLAPAGWEAVITVRPAATHTATRPMHVFAATASWARELDALQNAAGEGPALTAVTTGAPACVADVAGLGAHWPGLAAATTPGYDGAIAAFPITTGAAAFATLTAYRRTPAPVDANVLTAGADLAAIAARVLAEHIDEHVDRISAAVGHDAIAIATGMLSVRHHLSLSDAETLLRATAFGDGRTPRDVADDIMAGRYNPSEH